MNNVIGNISNRHSVFTSESTQFYSVEIPPLKGGKVESVLEGGCSTLQTKYL